MQAPTQNWHIKDAVASRQSAGQLVCYTAVFRVVRQRSSPRLCSRLPVNVSSKHYKMVVAFLTPKSISLSLVRNISTSIEENLEMRVSECRSFRNMKNLERLSIILMTKRHLELQGAVHKNLGTVQSSSVHTKPVNQLTETPSFWNRSPRYLISFLIRRICQFV